MKNESFVLSDDGKFVQKTKENDPNFKKEIYATQEEFDQKVEEYKNQGWTISESTDGYVKLENQFSKPTDKTMKMVSGWSPETIEIRLNDYSTEAVNDTIEELVDKELG